MAASTGFDIASVTRRGAGLTGAAIAGKKTVLHTRQSWRREMRRLVLSLGSVLLCCLVAGCDKCGDPVKFNVPSLPNACYDSQHQK